jgi:hypothetical protein
MLHGLARGLTLPLAALALAQAATAQTAPPAQVPPQELDATRHHQPTQAEVDQRERQLYGDKTTAQFRARQKAEVDRLYQELMGSPAPNRTQGSGASSK